MMVVLFVLFLISILILIDWLNSSPLYWRRKGVPCEIPAPIFGSTWTAFTEPLYLVWKVKYDKWKHLPYFGFHFFRTPALFISDPDILKKVYVTDSDHFMSHGMTPNEDVDLFCKNLLHVEGEQWRILRAKMSPFFSPARVKAMTPLLKIHLDNFVKRVGSDSSQGPVEVQKNLAMKLSTDVIVSSSFGMESNSFSGETNFFYSLQQEMLDPLTNLKMMMNFFSPTLYDFLGLTFFSKKSMAEVGKFVRDSVTMRCRGVGVQPDFLQGMVELMEKEDLSDTKQKYCEDGTKIPRFDMDGVTAQSLVIFLAGTDTTANTLGFLMHELAFHQDIQDKVRNEIHSTIQNCDSDYTYETVQKLQYTQMVINETLRKHPPIPILPRRCTKDYTLGDLKIDKGTIMMTSIYGVHMDPKYHPEPEKFIPERFAEGKNSLTGMFFPFGLGPRTCIGMKFAMIELLFATAKIFSLYKVFPSEKSSYKIEYDPYNLTLTAKNGIWLKANKV